MDCGQSSGLFRLRALAGSSKEAYPPIEVQSPVDVHINLGETRVGLLLRCVETTVCIVLLKYKGLEVPD
jgi:hypothetical protein